MLRSRPSWPRFSASTRRFCCCCVRSRTRASLRQGQTLQQIVSQKQQQDELKLLFQNAQDYEANYKSKVSTSSGSVAKAFTY